MERTEDKIYAILGDTINYFNIDGYVNFSRNNLICLYNNGLLEDLKAYINKYMNISKRKDYEYIATGSTSCVFRIGDYVFKLLYKKYDKEICPDSFLILKTYEKKYVRNKNNKVLSGIEVQPYLSKNARDVSKDILLSYKEELKKQKLEIKDSLLYGKYGDNIMLLDDYKDADYFNPELLPDWFKSHPLVLVDRDLVNKRK